MSEANRTNRRRRVVAVAGLALLGATLVSTEQAAARPYGYHGAYRHHRGVGVGAAIGLGVLGAAAAGVAASQYYNGYPVFRDGAHNGYGYDYYPDHGGYYGPY